MAFIQTVLRTKDRAYRSQGRRASSLEQLLLYEDVNVWGTLHLLDLAKNHKVEQFLFASLSSVYGGNAKTPFHEEDRISRTVST